MLYRPCYLKLRFPIHPYYADWPLTLLSLCFLIEHSRATFLIDLTHEIGELTSRLKANPRFTVMLGPPSSGKTTLAQLVTSQMRNDNTPEFHSLIIDLRSVVTSEDDCFLGAFLEEVSYWGTDGLF
ncbi:hypothetical protein MJO28_004382 [Puccinia striiformis f. sp. tritici]|uniref:Uncharacterized protein n=1 Tax=Puccinia striiformis f. sp. tritici TaxID=168172 RepID=A0ACC0ENX3_9BASI|nr:hypothetical protein MJO28_004382 [Puccinia striiformis f. sp. tritici]